MAQYDYDLFTIGAGSGGVRASRMSASFGAKVAVAEERYLGGTCVNVGCIPKKLLVYASHFGDDFDDAIVAHMKKTYNMAIGESTAERIKIEIGSAAPMGDHEPSMEVNLRSALAQRGLANTCLTASPEVSSQ